MLTNNKIVKTIYRTLKFLVKPDDGHFNTLFKISLATIKGLSFERSAISSEFFDSYYKQLEKAKNEKSSSYIKPNLEKLGEVVELARITNIATNAFIALIFFGLATTITPSFWFIFIQNIGLGDYFAFSNFLFFGLATTVNFWFIYYLIKLKEIKITQKMLKMYLKNDFTYIFTKALELDEELATKTYEFVKDTVFLQDTEKQISDAEQKINKILGETK